MDHLEGVGRGVPYPGPTTPFVAVPTTAGTGSEATKNAVLAERGPDGFKRSLRDERLVATVALLDPDLLTGCPPALIAGDGMDAVTQLIEPFTSTGASPFTDAIAMAGLEAARDGLMAWHAAANSCRRIRSSSSTRKWRDGRRSWRRDARSASRRRRTR